MHSSATGVTSYVSAPLAGSRTILIVDDEPALRQLLRRILTPLPYRVVEAADGLEALALARQEQPALILLDLTMPKLDGWGVLRALQADPAMRAIPVIVVTGDADLNEAMVVEAGAVALLRKPFQVAAVRAQVQAWVSA
jgi:CheY-like chemotaxis protein